MLPRWFRVLLAAEIAGLATFVVVGVHVVGQGVHTARDALTWFRPARPAPPAQRDAPLLPLTSRALPIPARAMYGAALLSPSLLVRLNRDTGATALGEYTLLLNLETLARDEVTRLLASLSTAPATAAASGR
jgi:hypothetical protein